MFLLIPKEAYYLILVVALGLFIHRLYSLVRLLGVADTRAEWRSIGRRLRAVLVYVFGQKRLFQDPYPGVLHALIFWGFVVLLFSTVEAFGKGFDETFSLPLLGGNAAFVFLSDLFALLVVVAVCLSAYRRLVSRPSRLSLSATALIILALIFLVMASFFTNEAAQLSLSKTSSWWQPVGMALSSGFNAWLDAGSLSGIFALSWWAHIVLVLGFLAFLTYSKHLHILAAAPNIFLSAAETHPVPRALDIARQDRFGASRARELHWKDKLDLFSCTECGRCEERCPAYLSGKPLSPKQLTIGLRKDLLRGNGRRNGAASLAGVVDEEAIWACTTCGQCQERCPVSNKHVSKITELRRGLTLMKGRFPSELSRPFQSLENHANPWSIWHKTRDWLIEENRVPRVSEENHVDVLVFVGCTAAFDDRIKKVMAAFVRVLRAAKVDFGVLGAEERCCGDPARRLGEEFLFQEVARQNIVAFKRMGVRRIVTACPHCFHVLKNEYPQLGGGEYEVLHHSQFLAQLIQAGKLKLGDIQRNFTFHDPCYLGRHNTVYDQPRQVIASLTQNEMLEVPRSRSLSFCCGGGGGHMWMAERTGKRLNQMRVQEIHAAGAETVATACPFCLIMLEDGLAATQLERKLVAQDLAELVDSAIRE